MLSYVSLTWLKRHVKSVVESGMVKIKEFCVIKKKKTTDDRWGNRISIHHSKKANLSNNTKWSWKYIHKRLTMDFAHIVHRKGDKIMKNA